MTDKTIDLKCTLTVKFKGGIKTEDEAVSKLFQYLEKADFIHYFEWENEEWD